MSYLTEVILRVDIENLSFGNGKDLPEDILQNLRKKFYKDEIREIRTIQLVGDGIRQENLVYERHFFNNEMDQEFIITGGSLAFVSRNYPGFEKFKEIFQQIADAFYSHFSISAFSRIGLRYINQISHFVDSRQEAPYSAWSKYIRNELLGQIKFMNKQNELARCMSEIFYNEDNLKTTFRFGIFNNNFPARIRAQPYILDIDTFVDGYTEIIEQKEIIESLHENSLKIFKDSVKAPLLKKLGL